MSEQFFLPRRFLELGRRNPTMPMVLEIGEDTVKPVQAAAARVEVLSAATALLERGAHPGDRVLLLLPTSSEHAFIDLAVLCVGAVSVPVYETDSVEQIAWILTDASPVGAVCHPSMRERLDAALRQVADQTTQTGQVTPISTEFWVAAAGELLAADASRAAEVEERADAIRATDVACIVYTSGTTGRSKGCVLTHGGLVAAVDSATGALPALFAHGERTLLFLPLAHVFARVVNYGCLTAGVPVGYSDPSRLAVDILVLRPTWLVSVPRVLEKVFASASAKSTGVKAKVFSAAVRIARSVAERSEAGRGAGLLALPHKLFDHLVYAKVRAALGGDLRVVISGGAPLDGSLDRFFSGAGIMVLEGYGLTESSAAHTVNLPGQKRAGSVGRPLPGAEVRIVDGEIQLRGPNLFAGYWRNNEATAVVVRDGWFLTGDLGELLPGGFLRITGRKKDIIVTSGGKNVQPAGLEEIVQRHPAVAQCVVVGDRRPFVAALIAVSQEWLTANPGASAAEIDAALQSAVDVANESVSRAESIRSWRRLPGELSVDAGELTATLKVRRQVVTAHYTDLLEDIYRPGNT